MEKYGSAKETTDDNKIRRRRIAFWMTKASDKHSEYAIAIAVPRQQWLSKRGLDVTFIGTLRVLFFHANVSPNGAHRIDTGILR